MADDGSVAVSHLSTMQTQVLLAVFLASTPAEALTIVHRNDKTAAAARVLAQMDYLVVGKNGAAVTRVGVQELVQNGYMDETGQTTEFGQQFYQKAVAALNEKATYPLISELITK